MNLHLRKTEHTEYFTTVNLTRETFWNLYNPGCRDHFILHNFRKSNDFIEELDVVAIFQDKIVGHMISTLAKVISDEQKEHEVLHVGPVSVDPKLQHQGIGTELIQYSIKEARKLGYSAMILFGNPDYYKRFGFKNAQEYQITTQEGLNFEAFQVLDLQDNGLTDIKGKFYIPKSIEVNEDELNQFEEQFPYKEKGEAKIKINL